jgi:hypothetical protein
LDNEASEKHEALAAELISFKSKYDRTGKDDMKNKPTTAGLPK